MVEPKKHFSDGEEVEVGNDDEGFVGSWYVGTVIQTLQPPLKKVNKVLLVEFHTIMEGGSSSKRLREAVDPQLVRPRPPLQLGEHHSFELYQSVDAFVYDGWWQGTISQVLGNERYIVFLPDSGKEMEFQKSELRVHLDWINGRWVHPQEQDSEVSQPGKKLKALDEVKIPTLKACGHPSAEEYSSDLPSTVIGMEQNIVVVEAVKQQVKVKIISPKPRREALAGNVAEQQEMEQITEHPMNDIKQRRMPRIDYKQLHKEGTRSKVPASLGGPEQTMTNMETTSFAVQGEDMEKEIEMDGACASNDVRNSNESCLPPDTGLSADSQPTTQISKEEDTCKDSSIGDLELQDSLDVEGNPIILEGTTADPQLEEAMRDDQNECTLQSVPAETPEREGLPYVKSPFAQKIVESIEVLRVMPQQLHFRPLEGLNVNLREGHAIGSLLAFANIVEQIGKTQVHCPLSVLQEMYEALHSLEELGYNVQPVQARLQEMIRIKNEQEQLYRELRAVEEEFNKEQLEELQLQAELDEMGNELVEREETLIQLNKKLKSIANDKEINDKNLAEVVSTMKTIKEQIDDAKRNYGNTSSSWMKNLQRRS